MQIIEDYNQMGVLIGGLVVSVSSTGEAGSNPAGGSYFLALTR